MPSRGNTAIRGRNQPPAQIASGTVPVVPALAEALIPQVPHIVEQLMELSTGRDVWALQPVPTADLRRSIHENVLGFLRVLAGRQPGNCDPLAVPMAWGHFWPQEGASMESMLRVQQLATQVLWQRLFKEARVRGPEVVQRLLDESGPVWDALDSYALALVEGFRAAETDSRRRCDERRDAVLDALIEGRGAEPSIAAEVRATLGLPTHGRFVVVVTCDLRGERAGRSLYPAPPAQHIQAAWRLRPDRTIGVLELAHTPLERLTQWLSDGPAQRVGVSGVVDGLADITAAYHAAETALQTLPAGNGGVACFEDRLLEALVVSNPQVAQRLARRTFGSLLDCPQDEQAVLLATLDSWFRCGCSAAKAAARLHCHRNTVLNRLRRVEALTGHSLDDNRHHLACQMALVAVDTLR
ncbi:PucR family transcriptional regulator [Streptomyces gobiensis]|uniref:PucR family transcriptional regulator n=1 Tax=Streptomyces gobiensis TaxID=2875706 RepID=UPI001E36BAB6|nr:PucR family transcriptional regulator [Streptomyces gobiensis]UGY91470.1 helix-turn-helix domain-containing protein [Streptomyces gobiensis]